MYLAVDKRSDSAISKRKLRIICPDSVVFAGVMNKIIVKNDGLVKSPTIAIPAKAGIQNILK
jgi:transcriptional regulator of NAD metabolism